MFVLAITLNVLWKIASKTESRYIFLSCIPEFSFQMFKLVMWLFCINEPSCEKRDIA